MANASTSNTDIIVVVVYFVVVSIVAIVSILRANRSNTTGYFLTGRDAYFLPLGLSLFVSHFGAAQFIGLSSHGAALGISISAYSFASVFALIYLGWFFSPVYIASGARTLPEYLSLRYGGQRLAVFVSIFSLIFYIFTRIVVDIFSLVIFIKYTFGWELYFTIILMVAIIAFSTALGGMKSILYSSMLYAPIILTGAIVLAVTAFKEIGSYENIQKEYSSAIPKTSTLVQNSSLSHNCVYPSDDAFHIFHDFDHYNQPWLGTVFGVAIVTTWYWCCDQISTQRIFSARSLSHAKAGTLLAGYLQVLPLFLIVIPGMISRALYTDEVACVDTAGCFAACRNSKSCFHIGYSLLVSMLLSPGVRGLLMITIMAASMSSLSCIFHSGATTFSNDVWKQLRGPNITERELIIVFKLFVGTLGIVTCWWISVVQNLQGAQLFVFVQSLYSYFSPPLLVCCLLGMLWYRINEEGTYWGLMSGITFGILRTVMDVVYGISFCQKATSGPYILHRLHHFYFCIISVVLCSAVTIVISLLTEPMKAEHTLARLTWKTRYDEPTVIEGAKAIEYVDKDNNVETELKKIDGNEQTARKRRRKFDSRFCGIPPFSKTRDMEEKTPSLTIERKWRWILNINALLLGALVSGLIGYFH
ncbi:sodium/glucose cotransporter 4-like [Glandiceps talaboti]